MVATAFSKKALLLGSGFVTKPTVQILADAGVEVTVACRTLKSAEELCNGLKNTHPISLDVNNVSELESQVQKVEVIISLIPYTYHVAVLKACIKARKNMVTTSYISPAMMELDKEAKEAGITVLNEIGLDPGIDHLGAVSLIEAVHKKGGKVTSFKSYCGGLPAPEASDNPFGYKFSWSSRGVLLALRNPAKYYEDGKIVDVASTDLMGTAKPYFIYPGFAFVAYPNRDSTPYKERYNIPEAQTIVRGTLRYQGFPEFIRTLVDMGFLNDDEQEYLKPSAQSISWKDATARILGTKSTSEDDIRWAISSKTQFNSTQDKERIMAGLAWIGLFSDEKAPLRGNPLDSLCATLERKMQYEPGERDLVMLQHVFQIENKDGSRETRTSTLVDYGDPNGYSAMAKLVGTPCAVAVLRILDGTIKAKGVVAPMTTEINEPIRKELGDRYGIEMVEKVVA